MGKRTKAGVLGIALLLLVACGGPTDEEIVTNVAMQWTRDTADEVAEAAAELIVREMPAVRNLAGSWLAGQINDKITWQYGDPQCTEQGRCDVTVTAAADIDVNIPLGINDTIQFALPFVLRVDVEAEQVEYWNPNLGSASVTSAE